MLLFQMQKDFQNKSVDEIAEEMADDIEQINVWKKFTRYQSLV